MRWSLTSCGGHRLNADLFRRDCSRCSPPSVRFPTSAFRSLKFVSSVPRSVPRLKTQRALRAAEAETQPSTPSKKSKSLFIFGFGYLALGLAKLLKEDGWTVSGTCRGSIRQKELLAQGFTSYLFDTDQLSLGLGLKGVESLRNASHILVSISPASAGNTCPVTWILGREFKHVKEGLQWIGFLSTTSVYGDHQGDWVTEESETLAIRGSGGARRQAEVAWLRFQAVTGLPVHIFRLAGIYGPERNAILAAASGRQSKRSGKQYTSRCHAYDICQALIASMEAPRPGEIYNVADDDPASRDAVLQYVRERLLPRGDCATALQPADESSPQPDGARPPDSSPAPGFGEEKRVSNSKMKQQLGVVLRFPTYKEGLQAIYQGSRDPF